MLASRGLALATVGRLTEARWMRDLAISATHAVEVRVLVPAIEAICRLRERAAETKAAMQSFVQAGVDSGAIDLIVTAYRGNGDLLEAMLASSATREQVVHIMTRAGDTGLLDATGHDLHSLFDPVGSLSRREREVYELLCDGLGNGEMAGSSSRKER